MGYCASGLTGQSPNNSTGPAEPGDAVVETDHDVRNPADMLVIERIAMQSAHTQGVGRVQAITRPRGVPIEHQPIVSPSICTLRRARTTSR